MIAKHNMIVCTSFNHFLQILSNPYIVTPIKPLLNSRCLFRNCFCLIIRCSLILIIFNPQGYSCERKDENIHFCLLPQTNVNPTSCSSSRRSLQSNALSELTNLVCFQMMHGFNRIHYSYIVQIGVHFEQILSQILGSFKVLQISSNILTRDKFLTLCCIAMVSKDNDFINFKNRGNSSNFTYKICSKV